MKTNSFPKVWPSLWQASSLSSALLFLIQTSGAISLTGLLQHGTHNGGQTTSTPIWNTLGNEGSFANIYVTEPNGGYEAPLLNSGNGAESSIAYDLAPGTYEFFFLVAGFWDNNPGEYGLNLFFDGDNVNPGIAAHSPVNVSTATPATAGIPTLALDGLSVLAPTPSDLSYAADGLRITLTSYGFGEPGVFGGPPLNRVSNLNSIPDSQHDSVGRFVLKVELDTDQDGIPDEYETNDGNYHSPTMTGTDPSNPDTDGDGLTDGVEVLTLRTDPNRVDTDRDGINDDVELANGTDPIRADTDDDGSPDGEDAFPLDGSETTDTDGDGTGNNADEDDDNDGLSDSAEGTHGTNPLLADTDGDGLNDPDEITFSYDPTNPDSNGDGTLDGEDDSDEDGLTAAQEIAAGSSPLKKDTDGDGLDDGAEVNVHRTNPAKADTDDDLLWDGVELTLTKTNPRLADSDGDGTSDADEDPDSDRHTNHQEVVLLLTDPLDGSSRFAIEFARSATEHSVTFPALSGRSYRVERSINMDEWSEVITFIGTGSTVSIPLV